MLSRVFRCAAALIAIGVCDSSGAEPSHPSTLQGQVSESPLVGTWTANLAKSTLHPDFTIQAATLEFSVTADTVTASSRLVMASGEQRTASETFRTDGTEVPGTLSPGVTLIAKWLSPHVLETRARKGGQEIGVVTYEVSADGGILTSTSSGPAMPEQTIVFERQR